VAGTSSVPPTRACVQRLPPARPARSIRPVRALKETRRYWLPLGAAVLCLYAASLGFPPIVAFVLIVAGVGLCLDAATTWLERTSSTGGMHDYKQ
jgi:hypothetical protein